MIEDRRKIAALADKFGGGRKRWERVVNGEGVSFVDLMGWTRLVGVKCKSGAWEKAREHSLMVFGRENTCAWAWLDREVRVSEGVSWLSKLMSDIGIKRSDSGSVVAMPFGYGKGFWTGKEYCDFWESLDSVRPVSMRMSNYSATEVVGVERVKGRGVTYDVTLSCESRRRSVKVGIKELMSWKRMNEKAFDVGMSNLVNRDRWSEYVTSLEWSEREDKDYERAAFKEELMSWLALRRCYDRPWSVYGGGAYVADGWIYFTESRIDFNMRERLGMRSDVVKSYLNDIGAVKDILRDGVMSIQCWKLPWSEEERTEA